LRRSRAVAVGIGRGRAPFQQRHVVPAAYAAT